MTDFDPRENSADLDSSHVTTDEFQTDVNRAKWLVKNQDLDAALGILLSLKQKFLLGAEVLDLLGEVLVQKGMVEEGVRYRTLHELVKMAFAAAPKLPGVVPKPDARGTAADTMWAGGLAMESGAAIGPETAEAGEASEEALTECVPVTPAMANEFIRQGHYDKALNIFRKLVEASPDDESLKAAKELAEKKNRDKRLLGVFNRWLKNMERMKTGGFPTL